MNHMENKLISSDGITFEYALQGTKRPAVIFINGAGGPFSSWFMVWGDLDIDNICLAYNRLGIGNSSQPNEPQTGSVMVKALKDLLVSLNIEPPYLLVGHSLGGLVAHLFTLTYPNDVDGIIFLESSTIDDVLNDKKKKKVKANPKYLETEHVLTTVREIQAKKEFPNIPLVVIAGTKPAFSWLMSKKTKISRLNHQKDLLNLTKRGKLILAEKSGHFPQFSQPQLVIDAICDLLKEIAKS